MEFENEVRKQTNTLINLYKAGTASLCLKMKNGTFLQLLNKSGSISQLPFLISLYRQLNGSPEFPRLFQLSPFLFIETPLSDSEFVKSQTLRSVI